MYVFWLLYCDSVCILCAGNIESGPYEDCCREMFGVHGYIIFTIDRLIQNITKQVYTLHTYVCILIHTCAYINYCKVIDTS